MIDYQLNLKDKNFTILGSQGDIEGNLKLSGIIRVAGKIKGNLIVDQGHLIIEREGFVEGKIECQELQIHGSTKGEVNCEGKVIIYSGSKVQGDVFGQTITIYPGAEVNAECHTAQTIS